MSNPVQTLPISLDELHLIGFEALSLAGLAFSIARKKTCDESELAQIRVCLSRIQAAFEEG
ncbi:MAG: hypothetical protein LBQ81_03045 [Zoogloeaceae bacterium]|jgi:hypothetical protein|nr:hypothetical protein [Zoogloeaceae bacterium]